jgi:carbamoyltransferase
MVICGIKFGHDGTVALIEGHTLVFSVELEKLDNRIRHAPLFDLHEVATILSSYDYSFQDVDHFVLDGWNPGKDVFKWGAKEIRLPRAPYIQTPLGENLLSPLTVEGPEFSYLSYPHYAGHAIGAYCTSPFARNGESAYLLSWDGGMVPYLYYFDAKTDSVENLGALFSVVGDLYAEMAAGFGPFAPNPNQWETLGTPGKIMAYVAYGQVNEELLSELERLVAGLPALDDSSARDIYPLNLEFLERARALPLMGKVEDADVIATYHGFIEKLLLESLQRKVQEFPDLAKNLCYAGGCALNIKWNQAIRRSELFEEVWIPPFPNDCGSALGAACCAMIAQAKTNVLNWSVYSGPAFRPHQPTEGWSVRECSLQELASLIHTTNEPVLFLDQNAELGPRALGNRSILAAATRASMKDVLNRIKEREDYRPVAPMCLESHAPEVFDPGTPDPFMLYDHQVRPSWKDRVPAIKHLDDSARLQTVNETDHPLIFSLLSAYHALSGIPLLCNTSANHRHKGFFPDLESATSWGRIDYIWSDGRLYTRSGD